MDDVRMAASARLDPATRSALGQFMTPWKIAEFMASLFSNTAATSILDAGAGTGALSLAALERFPSATIDAWEIDPILREYLRVSLSNASANIHDSDFIEAAINHIQFGGRPFTHAILNPPYKKIQSAGRHRLLLREVGIETVNLYTAFVALAILLLRDKGEIVAIIPRSFCNGTYYRPFRELMTSLCSIEHIHIFDSRRKAFKDDDVLQENIIIKLTKGGCQGDVVISRSHDADFSDYCERAISFAEIIKPEDRERFIHIPTAGDDRSQVMRSLFVYSLQDLGIQISTGPVVDFRLKEHCFQELTEGSVPLLYAHNFVDGLVCYPKQHRKPGAIQVNGTTRRWLTPPGYYVVTKRFTSKEEKRRVVAFVFDPTRVTSELIGFENHLNFFHSNKRGLEPDVAYGLAAFLNSTIVDERFRAFSGHTQVNATDLRNMRYPSMNQLRRFGEAVAESVKMRDRSLAQSEIDLLMGDASGDNKGQTVERSDSGDCRFRVAEAAAE